MINIQKISPGLSRIPVNRLFRCYFMADLLINAGSKYGIEPLWVANFRYKLVHYFGRFYKCIKMYQTCNRKYLSLLKLSLVILWHKLYVDLAVCSDFHLWAWGRSPAAEVHDPQLHEPHKVCSACNYTVKPSLGPWIKLDRPFMCRWFLKHIPLAVVCWK